MTPRVWLGKQAAGMRANAKLNVWESSVVSGHGDSCPMNNTVWDTKGRLMTLSLLLCAQLGQILCVSHLKPL